MLCEICKKRKATFSYSENINGKTSEIHLCSECAKKHGYYDKIDLYDGFINPADFLTSPFEFVNKNVAVCKNCGTTSDEFVETGYLGCSECYKYFADLVQPMIERVQKGVKHIGKTPEIGIETMNEKDKLAIKLKKALENEDYESAAKIRDQIKEIEKKEKNNG